jgi:hypothetical protein
VERLGLILGIAVAVAVVVFLRSRATVQTQRMRAAVVGLVVGGIFAAAGVFAYDALRDDADDTTVLDQAIANARAMPMVSVVLDDVPGSEGRLRVALKEEMHRPTAEGVSRPLRLMRELRADYVVPALRATDEASAAAVIDARGALLKHLQATDLVVCKEFALTGIQRTDRLDATGQKLLREVLAALEKAYRSGRTVKTADAHAPAMASDAQARSLLAEAGFAPEDFEKLAHLARVSEEDACAIALKFNDAPSKLEADKRGPLMRYLLTVQ